MDQPKHRRVQRSTPAAKVKPAFSGVHIRDVRTYMHPDGWGASPSSGWARSATRDHCRSNSAGENAVGFGCADKLLASSARYDGAHSDDGHVATASDAHADCRKTRDFPGALDKSAAAEWHWLARVAGLDSLPKHSSQCA